MGLIAALRCLRTMGQGVGGKLPDPGGDDDPIALFGEWFSAARRAGILLPETMTLATATLDGRPSARMILLKDFDHHGFVFYTNYESRKAKELAENRHVALVMHWPVLQRQIRIEGTSEQLTSDESSVYFRTRLRATQIGAWASMQSEQLDDRKTLEERVLKYEDKFVGCGVPLPPFWGGYRVAPQRIEFWQGRANRLHDRLCFIRTETGWESHRLYP